MMPRVADAPAPSRLHPLSLLIAVGIMLVCTLYPPLMALGWMPIKAHHWPGEGKITFIRGESAHAMDADAIQQQINQW
ncbi:hypothetical protein L9Z73_23230, partial [Pseudomonas sp. TNT11]|nr:hypothetical protein [Pseudomonas emilianonis]